MNATMDLRMTENLGMAIISSADARGVMFGDGFPSVMGINLAADRVAPGIRLSKDESMDLAMWVASAMTCPADDMARFAPRPSVPDSLNSALFDTITSINRVYRMSLQ